MKKFLKYFKRLKVKWEIKSNIDLVLILVVFALAGSSVLKIADFISDLIGVTSDSNMALWLSIRIFLIFPIYQALLLIFAFILGQFNFFWSKEKKLFKWIMRIFKTS